MWVCSLALETMSNLPKSAYAPFITRNETNELIKKNKKGKGLGPINVI